MLEDNALGVRKTLEKTSSEVSQGTTIGLCGKHELQEEIQRVRTVPYGQKAKKMDTRSVVGSYSSPGSPH